jgi:hypothetical protein
MKKLILALSVLALAGCSSRQLVPAVAGGVVGYALGSANNTVVVRQPAPVTDRIVVITEECARYASHGEKESCMRGVHQRQVEEQRQREDRAYRQGLGR